MAVSTSVGRKFTVNQIVTRSYRYAGLVNLEMEPSAAELRFGRDLLEDIFDRLPAEGDFARTQDFLNVPLTEDTFRYTLTEAVLDVLSPGMYISEDQADLTKAEGETIVRLIAQDEYQKISSKASKGRPTLVYADRTADAIDVLFWPIPDEDGTVRLRIQRRLADTVDGNANLDVQTYWNQYLIAELAGHLAQSASIDSRAMQLFQVSRMELEKAKAKANPRPGNQMRVDHSVGWYSSRRY